MATFTEKYKDLFPENPFERRKKIIACMKRALDLIPPQVKPVTIGDYVDGYAIYTPEEIVNPAKRLGDPEDAFSTKGNVTLYLRRLKDDCYYPVELQLPGGRLFDGASALQHVADNIETLLKDFKYKAAQAFCSGMDIGSVSTESKFTFKNVITGDFENNITISTRYALMQNQHPSNQEPLTLKSTSYNRFKFEVFATGEQNTSGFSIRVEDLMDDDLTRKLGIDNGELRKAILNEWKRGFELPYAAATRARNNKILAAIEDIPTEAELTNKYDEQELNFIAGAPTDAAILYRSQFIDNLENMLSFKTVSSPVKERMMLDIMTVSSLYNDMSNGRKNERMIQAIDNGQSFIPFLAMAAGTPNVSKKEYRRAMDILKANNSEDASIYRPDMKKKSLAFALAKLPEDWFTMKVSDEWGEEHLDLLTSEFVDVDPELRPAVTVMIDYAAKLGAELDGLKGLGDKKRMKEVMKPWQFMNKAGDLSSVLKRLEDKHKIKATFSDYSSMLGQLMMPVNLGAIYRADYLGNDSVKFDISDNELSIDTSHVTKEVKEVLQQREFEAREEYRAEWEMKSDITPLFEGAIELEIDGEQYTFESLSSTDYVVDGEHENALKRGEMIGLSVTDAQGSTEVIMVNFDHFDERLSIDDAFEHSDFAPAVATFIEKLQDYEVSEVSAEALRIVREQLDDAPEDVGFDDIQLFDDMLPYDSVYNTIEGFELKNAIRQSRKGTSLISALEMNTELHKHFGSLVQEANLGNKKNFQWEALFDGSLNLKSPSGKQYSLTNINTRLDLLEEGSVMNHCVFSYLSRCMAGEAVILSLKDEEGNRVATAELNLEPDNGAETCTIGDFYGYANSSVPKDADAVVSAFVDAINRGDNPHVSHDDIERVVGQEFNDDVLIDVENEPLENGSICSIIPYDGPGVYVAALAIEAFTPDDVKINSITSTNGLTYQVYADSGIEEGLDTIKKLAEEVGMSPLDVARVMVINELSPDSDELKAVVTNAQAINGRINELRGELAGQLPVSQIGAIINETLFEEFDVTLYEPEKMAAGHQGVVAVSQSIQTQKMESERLRNLVVESPGRSQTFAYAPGR